MLPLLLTFGIQSAVATTDVCDDCNVLWIVIDTTREDFVGPDENGRSHTPNLDRLGARGLVFEHAYAQGPDTMISVSSYMTGRYRLNTGMDFTTFNREQNFHPLAGEVTTIAEVLKSEGYRTKGFTSNALIAAHKWDLELHQGFESWTRTNDPDLAAQGMAALDELKDEPFLLYLHLMGPHFPNPRRPDFESRWGDEFPASLDDATGTIYSDVRKKGRELTEQEERYLKALYADDLWAADQEVGKVLDHLESLGLADETLVIFTSDHGEELGELINGQVVWGHGGALRRGLLGVPLTIAGPGIPAKRLGGENVAELVDLAPSIAGYLGIDIDPSWLWEGQALIGPDAVVGSHAIADRGISPNHTLSIRDAMRSVHYVPSKSKYFYGDLVNDPKEKAWVPQSPEHLSMQEIVQQYWDTMHPPGSAEDMDAPDGELLDQLQELGYME